MNTHTHEVILSVIERAAENAGVPTPIDPAADLISAGVFDSLGFVMALSEIEEQLGRELDLDDEDPADYVTLEGLLAVAKRVIR